MSIKSMLPVAVSSPPSFAAKMDRVNWDSSTQNLHHRQNCCAQFCSPTWPVAEARVWVFAILLSLATGIAAAQELPLPVATIERSEPVDFAKEIYPILKRNCLACHHERDAEGGLILETISQITKGGDSGPGVVAKDVAASLVFSRQWQRRTIDAARR